MLYPIKFRPRLKERIWGGSKLTAAGKRAKQSQNKERIGESWEISGIEGEESVISNGFLKNNNRVLLFLKKNTIYGRYCKSRGENIPHFRVYFLLFPVAIWCTMML